MREDARFFEVFDANRYSEGSEVHSLIMSSLSFAWVSLGGSEAARLERPKAVMRCIVEGIEDPRFSRLSGALHHGVKLSFQRGFWRRLNYEQLGAIKGDGKADVWALSGFCEGLDLLCKAALFAEQGRSDCIVTIMSLANFHIGQAFGIWQIIPDEMTFAVMSANRWADDSAHLAKKKVHAAWVLHRPYEVHGATEAFKRDQMAYHRDAVTGELPFTEKALGQWVKLWNSWREDAFDWEVAKKIRGAKPK